MIGLIMIISLMVFILVATVLSMSYENAISIGILAIILIAWNELRDRVRRERDQ